MWVGVRRQPNLVLSYSWLAPRHLASSQSVTSHPSRRSQWPSLQERLRTSHLSVRWCRHLTFLLTWITAQLTPPVPCVTTVVPFPTLIDCRTFIAVPAAAGKAAASSKDRFFGARIIHGSCTIMYCVKVPFTDPAPRLLSMETTSTSPSIQSRLVRRITASPILSVHVLPGPALMISPAPSLHGISPGGVRIGYRGESARQRRSR